MCYTELLPRVWVRTTQGHLNPIQYKDCLSRYSGRCYNTFNFLQIYWTNVGILLIRPRGTNFNNEISIAIHALSLKKSIWKCRLENGGHFVLATMCYTELLPRVWVRTTQGHLNPIQYKDCLTKYSGCCYKTFNFLPNIHKIHPYGMYFVGSNCDLYSASVTAVI